MTLSLAKLDRGAKKNRAALEDICRSYGPSTGGFATGDVLEAKALLDAAPH
jgi:hypothetical protein